MGMASFEFHVQSMLLTILPPNYTLFSNLLDKETLGRSE